MSLAVAPRCCSSTCRTTSSIPTAPMRAAARRTPDIAALPARLKPLAEAFRAKGGLVVATQFTLVPGRGGEPIISPHLKKLRPFLGKGDFAPGSWGQQLVDELAPADIAVEKVAYSAFYMTRLEWVLRKCGIERLFVGGIVTNGGVASTVRDAHVRDIRMHRAGGRLRRLFARGASGGHRRAAAGRQDRDRRRGDERHRGVMSSRQRIVR